MFVVPRDGINAQLNAVVAEITCKIQEQEKERIALDKENAELRGELQVCLLCQVAKRNVFGGMREHLLRASFAA